MTWSLILALLWILLVLGAWLIAPHVITSPGGAVRRAWLLVAAVALFARLVPNFLLPSGAGYDIESYEIVGDLVLNGEDVYASPAAEGRHPYLPFQMYWLGFARRASQASGLPFAQTVRLAAIAADIGIALLLTRHFSRQSASAGLRAGLLYALHPIPILVSAYHGQFDAIPALLLLLAIYRLDTAPVEAGGWLGLGILSKSWPVLALPSLFVGIKGTRPRLRFLALVLLVPAAGVALYVLQLGTDPLLPIGSALSYNWGVGVWGYPYLVRLLTSLQVIPNAALIWLIRYGRYITLAGLAIAWLIGARKEAPRGGVLTVLVTFFAITHAFSIQYLMWIVPFALLNQDDRWLILYTLAGLIYMFLVYATLIFTSSITHVLPWPQADLFIIIPSSMPVWLVTVAWTTKRLAKAGQCRQLGVAK